MVLMRALLPLVALAAGIVVLIVADGRDSLTVGGGLLAVATVLLLALGFYEVGASEDRARRSGRL